MYDVVQRKESLSCMPKNPEFKYVVLEIVFYRNDRNTVNIEEMVKEESEERKKLEFQEQFLG